MPIRLSGMNSGLDTDAIVTELVKAKSAKKTTLEGEQKKLQWKQDSWKALNSKIYSFYSKTLSNMRLKSDYMKKTTKSTSDAVSVVTGSAAALCTQTLSDIKMAKAGYLTGALVAAYTDAEDNEHKVEKTTLLKDLDITAGTTFKITGSEGPVEVTVDDETTLQGLLRQFNSAGVTANFDEANQRIFISANKMGAENDFTIESSSSAALERLGIADEQAGSKKIPGESASITLNGVTYTSESNTFTINDLTITVNRETDDDVTLSTTQDTDGIYKMIKDMIKEYNDLVIEMDKNYNAESAKNYKMLTDEEKDAMSEDEVKEWEDKIKSALLRRDSTLGNVYSSLKNLMLAGVEMADGSTKYLSDFGISTLSYFTAADNEKAAYHIDGDSDDSNTASNEDKLRKAIASNPDEVIEFFSSLSKNLYSKVGDLMARSDYSSAFTVYDDKKMKTDYADYTAKIAAQEEKITTWEDYYYKKFTAMEKALATLQSKETALSGLFGN